MLSLLLLSACTDAGLTAHNSLPTASITSHKDGDAVDGGVPIEFRGVVGDPNGAAATLNAKWYRDGELVCEPAAPDVDGNTACTMTIATGTATISLEVADAHNAAASDEINVTACAGTWYADLDGDSYGDAATISTACAQPTGYVADGTDCDDFDATASPALAEVCGDLVDNNCNGHADEGCLGFNCFDDSDIIENLDYYQTLGSMRETDALNTDGGYQDDYEFLGEAGKELAFHVWSDKMDANVAIYDSNCELYDSASDGARNTNPFLRLRVPTAGIWTVVVSTDEPAQLGSYVLEVINDSAEIGANCGLNTTSMDVLSEPYEDSYSGTLQSGDQLWGSDVGEGFYYDDAEFYAFYGDTVVTTESSTALDPVLSLFDPTCYIVTYDTDSGGGTTALIQTTLERTGIYTAVPWATYSYSTGNYTVNVSATF